MSYSKLVKKTRTFLGESQMLFAKRFGVTDAAVSTWETGRIDVPFRVLHFCFNHMKIESYNKRTLIDEVQIRLNDMAAKEATRKAPRTTIMLLDDGVSGFERESLTEQVEQRLGENVALRMSAGDFHHIVEWNKLGYLVKKGEQAFLATVIRQTETGDMIKSKVNVFHISQVLTKGEFNARYGYSRNYFRRRY